MNDIDPADRKPTNTQARWNTQDGKPDEWRSYGDVTHAEAARQHAQFFDSGGLIETRWEGRPAIFTHSVFRIVKFAVTSHRGD